MENTQHITHVDHRSNLNRSKTALQKILTYVGLGPEEEYPTAYNQEHNQASGLAIQNHGMRNTGMRNTQVFQTPTGLNSMSNLIPKGPQVVEAKDFSDSQKIADYFRANCPVVMNLEGTHARYTRRLVDFASGLVYGLNGTIRNISSHIFLLEPQGASETYNTNKNPQTYLEETETIGYN